MDGHKEMAGAYIILYNSVLMLSNFCFHLINALYSYTLTANVYWKLLLQHRKTWPISQYIAIPFSAMTLLAGFMMALSAEIGLRMGVLGSARSIITTWACSPTFSRTQMNLSDSMVKVLKPMLAGLMPRFWS